MALNKDKAVIVLLSVITLALIVIAVTSVISDDQKDSYADFKEAGNSLILKGGVISFKDGNTMTISKGLNLTIKDTCYLYNSGGNNFWIYYDSIRSIRVNT